MLLQLGMNKHWGRGYASVLDASVEDSAIRDADLGGDVQKLVHGVESLNPTSNIYYSGVEKSGHLVSLMS